MVHMRGDYTTEELTEQLKEQLGCPCTYFPPMQEDAHILYAYRQARLRGEREGFLPMLVVVDELLVEDFGFSYENKTPAQLCQELLSAPLSSGKDFLWDKLGEARAELEENEPGYLDQLVGEIEGGEGIDRFLSLWDLHGTRTVPVVLAEIPVKNPWEVFAFLPFGGWNDCPSSEEHMAVAKYWFETYQAVPALMTHDVLEYDLPKPVTRKQQVELAMEQYAYCFDIVEQGVGTIGRLADGLSQSTTWYFWWD